MAKTCPAPWAAPGFIIIAIIVCIIAGFIVCCAITICAICCCCCCAMTAALIAVYCEALMPPNAAARIAACCVSISRVACVCASCCARIACAIADIGSLVGNPEFGAFGSGESPRPGPGSPPGALISQELSWASNTAVSQMKCDRDLVTVCVASGSRRLASWTAGESVGRGGM